MKRVFNDNDESKYCLPILSCLIKRWVVLAEVDSEHGMSTTWQEQRAQTGNSSSWQHRAQRTWNEHDVARTASTINWKQQQLATSSTTWYIAVRAAAATRSRA
jgi:hypothetical protein